MKSNEQEEKNGARILQTNQAPHSNKGKTYI
jgi:hypothetical protein